MTMPISYVYGAEDNKADFVPEGVYAAEITKAVEGVSKAGNKKIEVEFKLENGHRVWDNLMDLPNCRWKTNQLAAALGFKIEDKKPVVIDENGIIGARVNLVLQVIDGKNKVQEYQVLGDSQESGEDKPFN